MGIRWSKALAKPLELCAVLRDWRSGKVVVFLVALLGAFLGTQLLAVELYPLYKAWDGAFQLVFLLTIVVLLSYWCHLLRGGRPAGPDTGSRKSPLTSDQRHSLLVWPATTALVLAHWAGEDIHAYLQAAVPEAVAGEEGPRLFPLLCAIVLLIVSIRLVNRFRHSIEQIRTLQEREDPQPRKVLILPVSVAKDRGSKKNEEGQALDMRAFVESQLGALKFTIDEDTRSRIQQSVFCRPDGAFNPGSLSEDIDRYEESQWNWWHLLRAIKPHVLHRDAQHLVLLGSKGAGGSFRQLATATRLIRHYLGDDTPTIWWAPVKGDGTVLQEAPKELPEEPENGMDLDFEDMEALRTMLLKIVDEFKGKKCHQSDVIIDATGGFKTASIAGALTTLFDEDLQFQYVQTIKPLKVIHYNVCVAEKPSLEP